MSSIAVRWEFPIPICEAERPALAMLDNTQNASRSLDVKALGVHCGPLVNTIECALVNYHQATADAPFKILLFKCDVIPVAPIVRTPIIRLLRWLQTNPSVKSQFETLMGHMFAAAILYFCKKHGIDRTSIDFVGVHGQSLAALSLYQTNGESGTRSAAMMAAQTGVTTLTNVRLAESNSPSNLANIDPVLLCHPSRCRVCLNIGPIVSLSIIPPESDGGIEASVNWDCGPGTVLIDTAMQYFTDGKMQSDSDGQWCAKGTINHAVVEIFLQGNKYIHHEPPKMVDASTFGYNDARDIMDNCMFLGMSEYDTVATLTQITVRSILHSWQTFLPTLLPSGMRIEEIYVCGEGASNSRILSGLKDEIPNTVFKTLDEMGVPSDARDAVNATYQGLEALLSGSLEHMPPTLNNAKSQRCNDGHVCGNIAPGQRWNELKDHISRFTRGRVSPPARKMTNNSAHAKDWRSVVGIET